jgi:hypothetical protein
MTRTMTKGTCDICHGVFGKAAMTRHLASCLQNSGEAEGQQKGKEGKLVHLLVDGRYNPQYWMHIELPADETLDTLDGFLRAIWVECCGHLSQFNIAGSTYSSYVDSSFGDKSMRFRLGKVLSPGMQFTYEYDFGTTTELRLKVIAERAGKTKKGASAVKILARNEPPVIACDVCGKPATNICSECVYDEGGWLCDECAETHECGEDMLLPVVNSPRVGMCGYTG